MEYQHHILPQEVYDDVRRQIVEANALVCYYTIPDKDGVFKTVGFSFQMVAYVNKDNEIKPL